jgi:hypothetical protein
MKWHWEQQDSFQEPLIQRTQVDYGWSDNGPNLVDEEGDLVLGVWGHDAWGVWVKERDAHLIAAAPELLEACLKVLDDPNRTDAWHGAVMDAVARVTNGQ